MNTWHQKPSLLIVAVVATIGSSSAWANPIPIATAHPIHSSSVLACAPLASVPALVDVASGSAIAYLARSIIEPHGWRLSTNAPNHWQGPGVSASMSGLSAADALRALTDAAIAAGWSVRTSTHRSECQVRMNFDPVQMAHIKPPSSPPAPPPAPPVPTIAAPVEPAPLQAAPVPIQATAPASIDTSLRLQSGDLIGERLSAWAQMHGYTLTWQAGALRAGADLHLPGQVEPVLESLAQAMRFNDVHLEIEIFANRAVRIQEVR